MVVVKTVLPDKRHCVIDCQCGKDRKAIIISASGGIATIRCLKCQRFYFNAQLPSPKIELEPPGLETKRIRLPKCLEPTYKAGARDKEKAKIFIMAFTALTKHALPKEYVMAELKAWNEKLDKDIMFTQDELNKLYEKGLTYKFSCRALQKYFFPADWEENDLLKDWCDNCEFRTILKPREKVSEIAEEAMKKVEEERTSKDEAVKELEKELKKDKDGIIRIIEVFPHDEFRKGQIKCLKQMAELIKEHKIVVLNPPTGFGKTAVYLAIAKAMNVPTLIVTPRRDLQEQLNSRYGVPIVMGKRNYVCSLIPSRTCKHAPCNLGVNFVCPRTGRECPFILACEDCPCAECDYANSVKMCIQILKHGGIVCINQGLIRTFARFAKLVILDEAHEIFNTFGGDVRLEFSDDILGEIDGCRGAIEHLKEKARKLEEKFLKTAGNKAKHIEKKLTHIYNEIDRLQNKIDKLLSMRFFPTVRFEKEVKGEKRKYLRVRPDFSYEVTLGMLPKDAKIIVVTATPPKSLKAPIVTAKANIPATKRPIIYHPIAKFTHNELKKEGSKVYDRIADTIAFYFKDFRLFGYTKKAIVHVTSYEHSKEIAQRLCYMFKVLVPDEGNLKDAVDKFLKEDFDMLIAPSIDSGCDFHSKDIALQFITKVPYPDLKDPAIQALKRDRNFDFNSWYVQEAIDKLVQAAGRVCRGSDDYGITIILDRKFEDVYMKNKDKFPDWFKEALIWLPSQTL
ncbi:MAG: hypothetical protein DRN90_02150 [Thermoproteota archaeon]|nr:MAG: hypothetical protein DRN90_02150 [Candidatus Korarchaeota archaeon]